MIVRIELSRSRTGKHAFRALPILFDLEKRTFIEIKPCGKKVKPMYSKGEAYLCNIDVPSSCLLIYLTFVKNLRNRVRGYIDIISPDGRTVLRVKYVDYKIRRVCGDPTYGWIIEELCSFLKIPYRRINMKTGSDSECSPRELSKAY